MDGSIRVHSCKIIFILLNNFLQPVSLLQLAIKLFPIFYLLQLISYHIKYMNRILKVYILFLLPFIINTANISGFKKEAKSKTIVQSNHFVSEQQKSITYNISNVEIGKTLIFLLKKKNTSKYNIEQNNLQITFHILKQTSSCQFKTYTDLCVIQNITSPSVQMVLSCHSSPCEASWIVYQLESNQLSAGSLDKELYSIEGSANHLAVFISCDDPGYKNFTEDVVLYSNSHFQREVSNNKLYFLFANEQKGFLYFDTKENMRKCGKLSFTKVQTKVHYSNTLFKDFTNKHSPSKFQLQKPTKDIRIDGYIHRLDDLPFESQATIKINTVHQDKSQLLHSYSIPPYSRQSMIDFSITVKQPTGDFSKLQLQIIVNQQKIVILNIVVNEYQIQEVNLLQRTYFTLNKGDKVSYKLLPEGKAKQEDFVYFLPGNNQNLIINPTNCSAKNGCNFQIEAKDNLSSYIYFSPSQQYHSIEANYIPLVKSASQKIKQGQVLYFTKQMKEKKTFQIAVNNPNIIVYGAQKDKCIKPSKDCNERKGNYLHPFAYDPKNNGEFLISAVGLQSGEFIITVIDQQDQYIHLDDGKAFIYRIQEKEDQILFKYKIKQKIDVSFNLVAPLNHLVLVVYNGDQADQSKRTTDSQGFITIGQEDIESLNFILKVKKTALSKNKMSHFTLIATTATSLVRLQPTVAHYQNISPNNSKEYIFQYDPSQQYILNFYTPNLNNKDLNIMICLSNNRDWNNKDLQKMYIDLESDFLDLKHVSELLCRQQEQESCQIFLILRNQMGFEVDITITLMTRYSVIELKDGLWQSYQEGTIASTANFYFYPKHIDKNVIIIYSTVMEDLQLTYTLWKTDSKSLDPRQWPFPEANQLQNYSNIRAVNQINIDKQSLKKECWPFCLILLTLHRDHNIKFKSYSHSNSFKIMASNNQIELPQKTRINLVLKSNETKELIIDLKYALQKEYITFYTSHTIGSFAIYANVISSKTSRCPISQEQIDFQIKHGETIIQISRIKLKISSLRMEQDGNFYLCLFARGFSNSKFSIQYTSQNNQIQSLHLNSFQKINLGNNQTKIFQIEGYHDFVAKILRTSGFPYVFIKKCLINQIKICEEQTLASKQMGTQIAHKNQQFDEEPCNQCLYLFKFQTFEPSIVNLHLLTKNSQLQLKEHEIITDFILEREESKYSITHIQKEDLLVNIHVIDGEIIVKFTNYNKISLIKDSQPNKKAIHFFIPKQYNLGQQKSSKDSSQFGSYKYSNTFSSFHLVIKSKNINTSATYSITYSSGQNQIYLQDGLITDIALEPNIPSKFYYQNQRSSSQIYLTISATDQNILSQLKIHSYYYEIEGEDQNKVQFLLDIPKIRKKTPNPTLLLALPEKNYFQIDVNNTNNKIEVVSIGINHQQLIILPLNHEFPFTLVAKQQINFLIDISKAGYVQAQIRKCDESEPIFSYSFNYESFIKGDFITQIQLNEDPKFQDYIKIVQPGTFYINIKSQQQSSLLAINLRYYQEKPKNQLLRAGNRGIIEYEFSDAKKAILFIAPVLCQGKQCQGIKYYSMNSKSLEDLYSQLVCPSNFFSISSIYTNQIIPLVPISYEATAKIINFTYNLPHHTSYVAVKAVTTDGQQIYYKPAEIVTVWGHLSKTSKSYKLTIALIVLGSICILLMFVRHNARRGYKKIDSEADLS